MSAPPKPKPKPKGRPTPHDERGAAYREYDKGVSAAWEADPEFGNALSMAYVEGNLKLLRDYITAGKPIPQEHVFMAGELIPMHVLVSELLGSNHQPQQQPNKGGRPHRAANKAPATEQAEHNAAWLVAFALQNWRERNGRNRVPGVKKNEMIKAAIEEAAKAFGVSADTIDAGNIRNLLKNRQVVVA